MPGTGYAPGKAIPGFKPGQGMSVGLNSKESVSFGTAKISVETHVTLTTKTSGGRGIKGQTRYINHFHVTFENKDDGKYGQYNFKVNNGSIASPTWGGNNIDIPDDVQASFLTIANKKKAKMAKIV